MKEERDDTKRKDEDSVGNFMMLVFASEKLFAVHTHLQK